MKWPLFENKIKDDLFAHRSEVDVDALWSAIEPEVDAINQSKRKKRRGAFWLLFGGLLLVGGVSGYFFFGNSGNGEKIVTENNIVENQNQNDLKDVKKIEGSNIENNKNEFNEIEKEAIDEKNKINKSIEKNNSQVGFIKNENKIAVKEQEKINNVKINKAKRDKYSKEDKIPEISNSDNLINKISEDQSGYGLAIETTGTHEPLVRVVAGLSDTLVSGEQVKYVPQEVTKIEKADESADELFVENDEDKEAEEDRPNIAPNSRKAFRFSMGINGGISYADRKMEALDADTLGLFGLREKYERQLETSYLGVHFVAEHRSGFNFTSGLQYTRMVELYERNGTETIVDSIMGVAYFAVLPNDDTVAVEGMVPLTTINTLEKKYYNKYTMLDVPLLIGYRYVNNDWAFAGQAGVFANISITAEGRVLKNEIEEGGLKEIIKSNIGLSYFAGFSAGYQFNNNLEISVSPYGRFFPKSFTKNNYALSQKYLLVGLDVRFRYWF